MYGWSWLMVTQFLGVTIGAGNQLSYILIYNSLLLERVTNVQRGPLMHTFAEHQPRKRSLTQCGVPYLSKP